MKHKKSLAYLKKFTYFCIHRTRVTARQKISYSRYLSRNACHRFSIQVTAIFIQRCYMNREQAIADLLRCGAVDKTAECGYWQPSQYEGEGGKRYYELKYDGVRKLGFMFDYAVYNDVWLRFSHNRTYQISISDIPVVLRYYGYGDDYLISENRNLGIYATPIGIALGLTLDGKEKKYVIAENSKKNQIKTFYGSTWVLGHSWHDKMNTIKRKYIVTSKEADYSIWQPKEISVSSKHLLYQKWYISRDDDKLFIGNESESYLIANNELESKDVSKWLNEILTNLSRNTIWQPKYII